MDFPIVRKRRLRQNSALRSMVREVSLSKEDLIAPLFVVPGEGVKKEISSMPEQYQLSIDKLIEECEAIYSEGIPAVILFGIPESKDAHGSQGYHEDGIVQKAVRAIKEKVPDLIVITDVCLCEYTDHGHCGVLSGNDVHNDKTIKLLSKMAISHVKAGADIVAPSDMMDGRIQDMRKALDENGFENTPIMSYSTKFASAYYGPFREAAESTPEFGDRKTYQMDYANPLEAIHESELDEMEGADILMVKPALAYLDIIYRIKSQTKLPLAAYNVSGEYSMIMFAAKNGLIDLDKVMMETLVSIKRAGADLILTYFARRAARILQDGNNGKK